MKQQQSSEPDRGMFGPFCGLNNVDVFLSVFKHDYGVVLFLSSSSTITKRPCLMLIFYEIPYVPQENTRALLTVPPSSQISGADFLFFNDSFSFFEVTGQWSQKGL